MSRARNRPRRVADLADRRRRVFEAGHSEKGQRGGGGDIGEVDRNRRERLEASAGSSRAHMNQPITASSGSSLIATVTSESPPADANADRIDRGQADKPRRWRTAATTPGPPKPGPIERQARPRRRSRAAALRRPSSTPRSTRRRGRRRSGRMRVRYTPECRRRRARDKLRQAKAMHSAPTLLTTQPSRWRCGRAARALTGSMKMPEPIIVPTTSALVIQMPSCPGSRDPSGTCASVPSNPPPRLAIAARRPSRAGGS